MNALAPAKVILGGEHAVVYGAPALALAIDRYARVAVLPARQWSLELCELGRIEALDPAELRRLRGQLDQRHRAWSEGRLAIDDVLQAPSHLYRYALALGIEYLALERPTGHFRLDSDIPAGAGMGSSAATVAALLQALAGSVGRTFSTETLCELCSRTEQLQHGRSSGLDPAVVSRGGLLRFQKGKVLPLNARLGRGWYLIQSGRPMVGTGEVVAAVRERYPTSHPIWSDFARVCGQLEQALVAVRPESVDAALRENQRLLTRIGVVPSTVAAFVAAAEAQGAAVKVSGAGAHRGEAAGLLLWRGPNPAPLCQRYGYAYQPLEEDRHGARFGD